jgi:hypothetical protein
MTDFALRFTRPIEMNCSQLMNTAMPYAKSGLCSATPLPLPMHGLTLCGFERRPSQMPIQAAASLALTISPTFTMLPSKRPRDQESLDSESAPRGRETPHGFDHAPSQLQGPSSDGESTSRAACSQENRHDRIRILQQENSELQMRIRTSDEELQRLREIINQLFEVEKSQKRSKDDSKPQRRYWNNDEHERFLQALQRYLQFKRTCFFEFSC